jgi:hypothetical protein
VVPIGRGAPTRPSRYSPMTTAYMLENMNEVRLSLGLPEFNAGSIIARLSASCPRLYCNFITRHLES